MARIAFHMLFARAEAAARGVAIVEAALAGARPPPAAPPAGRPTGVTFWPLGARRAGRPPGL